MTDPASMCFRSSWVTPRAAIARLGWDRLLFGGMLVLVAAGLGSVAATTAWHEIGAQLARLNTGQIGILLALSLVNYVARGLRWHLFAVMLGLGTTMRQNLRHFFGGFAMSVTPGRLGELVRLKWIRREAGLPPLRAAPLSLADRAADLAAMGLILGISLVLSRTGIEGAAPVAIIAVAGAFVATRSKLLIVIMTRTHSILGRGGRFFAQLRSGVRSLAGFAGPLPLGAAMALGFIGWLAEAWAFHILLVWMGAEIDLWTAIAIFICATLAGGLTGAPGGLGGTEAAMIALLSLQGVPTEISLPVTAVIRLTTLWFAIALGLVIFPHAERMSRRGDDALENG